MNRATNNTFLNTNPKNQIIIKNNEVLDEYDKYLNMELKNFHKSPSININNSLDLIDEENNKIEYNEKNFVMGNQENSINDQVLKSSINENSPNKKNFINTEKYNEENITEKEINNSINNFSNFTLNANRNSNNNIHDELIQNNSNKKDDFNKSNINNRAIFSSLNSNNYETLENEINKNNFLVNNYDPNLGYEKQNNYSEYNKNTNNLHNYIMNNTEENIQTGNNKNIYDIPDKNFQKTNYNFKNLDSQLVNSYNSNEFKDEDKYFIDYKDAFLKEGKVQNHPSLFESRQTDYDSIFNTNQNNNFNLPQNVKNKEIIDNVNYYEVELTDKFNEKLKNAQINLITKNNEKISPKKGAYSRDNLNCYSPSNIKTLSDQTLNNTETLVNKYDTLDKEKFENKETIQNNRFNTEENNHFINNDYNSENNIENNKNKIYLSIPNEINYLNKQQGI